MEALNTKEIRVQKWPSLFARRGSTQITKNVQVDSFREFYSISPPSAVQVVLSAAHPAKFSEAVTKEFSTSQGFDFERDVLRQEFRGLLEKMRGAVDADEPKKELVKTVIESNFGSGNGV